MNKKSLLKMVADISKDEPFLKDIKEKTLDLISFHQPLFAGGGKSSVKIGTRVFLGDDKRTVYVLFKYGKKILMYGAEYDFEREEDQGDTPNHLFALREEMDEEDFREVLLEDDEEYLHEFFECVTQKVRETDEMFIHRNAAWLLGLLKN